jgi:hypothetical protein
VATHVVSYSLVLMTESLMRRRLYLSLGLVACEQHIAACDISAHVREASDRKGLLTRSLGVYRSRQH